MSRWGKDETTPATIEVNLFSAMSFFWMTKQLNPNSWQLRSFFFDTICFRFYLGDGCARRIAKTVYPK